MLLSSSAALAAVAAPNDAEYHQLNKRAVISSSTTNSAYNAQFGTAGQLTTVNPGESSLVMSMLRIYRRKKLIMCLLGVLVWLNGGSTHNWYGNVDNSGAIYISQTAYLASNPGAGGQTCDYVGHSATDGNLINRNGAVIQLNDIGSASAPTYDWYVNDGFVYLPVLTF